MVDQIPDTYVLKNGGGSHSRLDKHQVLNHPPRQALDINNLKIFKTGLNRPYLFRHFCIYICREMMRPEKEPAVVYQPTSLPDLCPEKWRQFCTLGRQLFATPA